MRKLKLNFEDLEVESFDTAPETAGREGTVYGLGYTEDPTCPVTCGATCPDTCPPRSCLETKAGFPCP